MSASGKRHFQCKMGGAFAAAADGRSVNNMPYESFVLVLLLLLLVEQPYPRAMTLLQDEKGAAKVERDETPRGTLPAKSPAKRNDDGRAPVRGSNMTKEPPAPDAVTAVDGLLVVTHATVCW